MRPWHPTVILLTLTIVCAIMHNTLYGMTRREEAAFQILTLIFAVITIISFVVALFRTIRYKYFLCD